MDKKPEKLVPEVRFKGFTDDWEQHKPKDYLRESRILGHSGRNSLKLTVKLWGKGIVAKKTIGNGSQNTKYYKRMPGQLMYGKLDFLHAAFGIVPSYLRGFESTTDSPAFDIVSGDPSFLLNEFLRKRFYERYGLMANGSRKAKRVHEKDFLNMAFYSGSDEEQYKIGAIIETINSLITLQQRKLKQLKQLKKAMLQQLFVDKNCKQPILRFKNFNDNWEERKLSDIVNYRNGKAHEQYIDMNGIYTVVNSKFISTNGKVKKFSNKPIELLKKGEIAFVLSDVPNGKALAKTYLIDSDNKYSLNQRIAGITPNSDINSYFLYILMNRNRYFLKFDDGVGQTNLSKKDIEEFKENYPLFDEQQKIANLFSKIQTLITRQQNKLTQLIALKKYLLQNLFI